MKAVIAVIATLLLLTGCGTLRADPPGKFTAPGVSYEGDSMGAALVGYAYITRQNQPAQAINADPCPGMDTSAGEAACQNRLAIREAYQAGGGQKQQARDALPIKLMEIQARKDMNTENNWFNLANVLTGGVLGLIRDDRYYDHQTEQQVAFYEMIETGFENGGTKQIQVGELTAGGDVGFSDASHGSTIVRDAQQVAGSDIVEGGKASGTNDTQFQSPIDLSGGDGEAAGSGGSGVINPVDAQGQIDLGLLERPGVGSD